MYASLYLFIDLNTSAAQQTTVLCLGRDICRFLSRQLNAVYTLLTNLDCFIRTSECPFTVKVFT